MRVLFLLPVCCWLSVAVSLCSDFEWVPWDPPRDNFAESAIDLRSLNEKVAGEHGRVRAENGGFVLGNGNPVRFWAVNGPPQGTKGDDLERAAKTLAKRGVNLVRIHRAMFDSKTGILDPDAPAQLRRTVTAFKREGIYTHLSIYFPLWLKPSPDHPFLKGYDGKSHPFAALMFNPEFQAAYQDWWKTLLTAPGSDGEPSLIDDPAVFGVEIQNEDSFFFWTFRDSNLPDPQRHMLQQQFGEWVRGKHGSFQAAYRAWDGAKLDEDDEASGRMAFPNLHDIVNRRSARDQDSAEFLYRKQRGFYEEQARFLRDLGFKGLITASNWTTANNAILGPLEKHSYMAGDFLDWHGYWGGLHQGDNAAWSIRDGHVFSHRSALKFDPAKPGEERKLKHPVFAANYNNYPSMLSETAFTRPNRFRTEAPLFYAVYSALQGTDALVHFAHDGVDWEVKPRFFMQPWTLMSPTQMGQFPAAALIFRQGFIREGDVVANVRLNLDELLQLKGGPLLQEANLDELRKTDAGRDSGGRGARAAVDPVLHLAGKIEVTIADERAHIEVDDVSKFHDNKAQTVRSSTGETLLDYGKGVLIFSAPRAQGAVGNLNAHGSVDLPGLEIVSPMDLLAAVLVPLDNEPLASSRRMLLQVMSEEQASGFETEPAGEETFRIVSIGKDPWLMRAIEGTVTLKRDDAARLKITPLDANGAPAGEDFAGPEIALQKDVAYYLIETQ